MTIKPGDQLPDVTLTRMGASGPEPVKTGDFFKGRKIILFSVPGAFTPTCHKTHLPGFVKSAEAIKAKVVDAIAVVAVNDAFALDAWLEASGAKGKVEGLADGSAAFAKATGTELDLDAAGLGTRSKRYAALVDDGVVRWIDIEDNSSRATVSSAEAILGKL
jgi:glutaredoxin/glutathione-dependent peroxiredoxin